MKLNVIYRENWCPMSIETDDCQDLTIYAINWLGFESIDSQISHYPLEEIEERKSGKKQVSKEIENARSDYFDVFGQEVPNNKKNDVEWMNAKVKKTLVEDEIIPEVTEEVIVPEVVKEMIENPIVETVVEEAPEAPEVIVPEEIKKPEIIDGDTEVLFWGEAIKGDILAKELEDGRKLLATIIDDPELQEDWRYKFTVVYKYL